MAGGTLGPGGRTGELSLAFSDPDRVPFTYRLVFLGRLDHAPAITSVPVVEALAGHPTPTRRRPPTPTAIRSPSR